MGLASQKGRQMDKTVYKLIRIRDMRFIALFVITFLYCLVCFFFHVDQLFIFISVFVLAIASVIAVYYACGYRIRNRLAYLVTEAMDAELLKEEASHVYPKSDGSWKTRYGRLYYESIYYNLLGDHENALEAWKALPTPNELLRNAKECGLMQRLIRGGRIDEATLHLENVQRIMKSDKRLAAGCLRILGSYYAAKGDDGAGREYLDQAYARVKYRSEKIGILYDLGVLAENLGKKKKPSVIIAKRLNSDQKPGWGRRPPAGRRRCNTGSISRQMTSHCPASWQVISI